MIKLPGFLTGLLLLSTVCVHAQLSGSKKFEPIVAEIGKYNYGIVHNIGDKFLIRTNDNAPNNKVMLRDPAAPGKENWKEVIRN